MRYLYLLLAFLFAAFISSANSHIFNGGKNDLCGGVIQAETKKPLTKVTITVYAADKKQKVAVTDNKGNFLLSDLKPGMYRLVFEKDGYKRVVKEKVVIKPEDTSTLNVQMAENDDFRIIPGQIFFTDYN